MSDSLPVTAQIFKVNSTITRISIPQRGGILNGHIYIISTDHGAVLIDSGPKLFENTLFQAVQNICPIHSINAILVLDPSPSGNSAIGYWRKKGFTGSIIADWRTAIDLESADVKGPYQYVHKNKQEIIINKQHVLSIATFSEAPGYLWAAHRTAQCIFCGLTASSMGSKLPENIELGHLGQLSFAKTFPNPGIPISQVMNEFDLTSALLLPRFGAMINYEENNEIDLDPNTEKISDRMTIINELKNEISKLKVNTISLQSDMVVASDSALLDVSSGLYKRPYAEEFVQSLLESRGDFCCGLIHMDKAKEINRIAGAIATDKLIGDLGVFLSEQSHGGFLFRWSGPTYLLVKEGELKEALPIFDMIRELVQKEKRFSRAITVSIALITSNELSTNLEFNPLQVLQRLSMSRLQHIEKRGGNGISNEEVLSDPQKYMTLILDGNSMSSAFMTETFKLHGFQTLSVNKGADAFTLMDQYKPEVVIADVFMPQFDAFQIRARMNESQDLRNIPLILLVPRKTQQLIERALSLKIYHVFERPVNMLELLGVMKFLAGRSSDGR